MALDHYVYLYSDAETDRPLYVGKGHDMRAYEHKKRTHNKKLSEWIKERETKVSFLTRNMTTQGALAVERFWIAVFGREDIETGPLFNKTAGGQGLDGFTMTPEQIAKGAASRTGLKATPAHILALKNAKRPKHTAAHIAKFRAARIGQKQPQVTCPHCGITGGNATMPRWHFDRCSRKV